MKYTERELMERDIFEVESSGWYLLGDIEINTNDNDWDYDSNSNHGVTEIDLSNFQVSDNDLVIINGYNDETNKWNLLITNCNKPCGTEGFAYFKYMKQYGMSDDTRYYVACYVASLIKDMGVKNVTVKFYLWRTEKEIEDYMEWVESMDI